MSDPAPGPAQTPAQPPISPDGMWWWDGAAWQPTEAQHAARRAAEAAHTAVASQQTAQEVQPQVQQVSPQQATAAAAPAPGKRRADVAPTTGYSNWVKRVGASLVDSLLTLPFNIISIVAAFTGFGAIGFGAALGAMAAFAWWNIFWRQGKTGYTLGKQILGIRLVDAETGLPIGPLKSFLRQLAHILDSFLMLGFLWPLWDKKRQTFADKICATVVIDEPRTDRTEGNARLIPVVVVLVGLVLGALLSTFIPATPSAVTFDSDVSHSTPDAPEETAALDPEAAQAEVWIANWCEARDMQSLDAVLAAMGAPTEIEQGGGENVTLIWEGDNLKFQLGFEGERKNDGGYQQVSGEVSRVPCM